jgi:hypothetical protein
LKKGFFSRLALLLLLSLSVPAVSFAERALDAGPEVSSPAVGTQDENTVGTEAVRGPYRSPSGSFSGSPRTGPGPGGGYRTGPRAPSSDVARNPRYQTPAGGAYNQPYSPGRAGSFFGGLAAGALLSHLLNPFAGFGYGYGAGYGGGYGYSIISILFWIAIIYIAFRLFQRFRRGNR